MKVSEFAANVEMVLRWYRKASPEERTALSALVEGIDNCSDPSGKIVQVVGEDRAAVYIDCWRDCMDRRAAR